MLMFPVLLSPKIKLSLLVVASVPAAERYAPPVEPERVATGVLVATPVIANLAALVACPPIKRSVVELFGNKLPLA